MIKTNITKSQSELNVVVDGRLDTSTSEGFLEKIDEVLDGDISGINIDCEKLEYISSAGLRSLMALCDRFGEDEGAVVLSNLTEQVRDVLKMTGMIELFKIV